MPLPFRFRITRRQLWAVATLMLVVLLATHPELRLLVPLVDALGLDTLLMLLAAQGAALLGPLPLIARIALATQARRLDRASERHAWLRQPRDFARYAVFHWIDPRLWHGLHTARLAVQRA